MVSFGSIARSLFLTLLLAGWAAAAELSHYPPAGSVWDRGHYLDFYFAHFNGNRALPHLRKPEQRVLFARVVDEGNFEAILSGPGSDADKARHLAAILGTMGEIRAAYAYAVLVGEPLEEELTQVQIFILRLLAQTVALAQPEARSAAWRTAFLGIATSLAESWRNADQSQRLIDAIGESYPKLGAILDDRARLAFRERIENLAAAGSSNRSYQKLLDTLDR